MKLAFSSSFTSSCTLVVESVANLGMVESKLKSRTNAFASPVSGLKRLVVECWCVCVCVINSTMKASHVSLYHMRPVHTFLELCTHAYTHLYTHTQTVIYINSISHWWHVNMVAMIDSASQWRSYLLINNNTSPGILITLAHLTLYKRAHPRCNIYSSVHFWQCPLKIYQISCPLQQFP